MEVRSQREGKVLCNARVPHTRGQGSARRRDLRYLQGRCPGQFGSCGWHLLVRTGELEVLEGDWHPKRVVVIRFDSAEAARRWLSGSGYSELRAMRHRAATTNMILVEGVAEV